MKKAFTVDVTSATQIISFGPFTFVPTRIVLFIHSNIAGNTQIVIRSAIVTFPVTDISSINAGELLFGGSAGDLDYPLNGTGSIAGPGAIPIDGIRAFRNYIGLAIIESAGNQINGWAAVDRVS